MLGYSISSFLPHQAMQQVSVTMWKILTAISPWLDSRWWGLAPCPWIPAQLQDGFSWRKFFQRDRTWSWLLLLLILPYSLFFQADPLTNSDEGENDATPWENYFNPDKVPLPEKKHEEMQIKVLSQMKSHNIEGCFYTSWFLCYELCDGEGYNRNWNFIWWL